MSNQLTRTDPNMVPTITQSIKFFRCMGVISIDLFDGSKRWLSMDAFMPNHSKHKAKEYEKEIYDTASKNVESFINKNIYDILSDPPSEKALAIMESREQFFNSIFAK